MPWTLDLEELQETTQPEKQMRKQGRLGYDNHYNVEVTTTTPRPQYRA